MLGVALGWLSDLLVRCLQMLWLDRQWGEAGRSLQSPRWWSRRLRSSARTHDEWSV